MVVGGHQIVQFLLVKKITEFLQNKRALSKFKYWILHYLISIIKLKNNYPGKPNFVLTTRATLKARFCVQNKFYVHNKKQIVCYKTCQL